MNRLISRAFSSAATAGKTKISGSILDPAQWHIDQLPNGIKLVSSPTNEYGPCYLSAMFSTGSRHEDYSLGEEGITHFIRRSAGLSTFDVPSVDIVRTLQQIGASFQCTTTREHTAYNICLGDLTKASEAIKNLSLIATKCEYYPWELADILGTDIKEDIHQLYNKQIDVLLSELLHKASFGNQNLANSLFAPKHILGSYEFVDTRADKPYYAVPADDIMVHLPQDKIWGFVNRCMRQPTRLTLVTTGLTKEELSKVRSEIMSDQAFAFGKDAAPTSKKADPEKKPKFYVGDQRHSNPNLQVSLVAAGWAAPAFGAANNAALSVLMRALGGATDKRSSISLGSVTADQGILAEAIQIIPNVVVSSLQWSYSDIGVAGFQLAGPGNSLEGSRGHVTSALHSVFKTIKKISKSGLTADQLAKAKAGLKVDTFLKYESPIAVANQVGLEVSLTNSATGIDKLLAAIENVTVADTQKVAAEIFSEKAPFALSAVGDIWGIPYVEDFKA